MNQSQPRTLTVENDSDQGVDVQKPVDLPIQTISSDGEPTPPTNTVDNPHMVEPASASLDLLMPILDVLTDPAM